MSYQEFFKKWGPLTVAHQQYINEKGIGGRIECLNVEELYQMFKARLIDELQIDISKISLMTEHGDRVEQMFSDERGTLEDKRQ